MKAARLENWKSMKVQDMPLPALSAGEALIEVAYAGVCGSDITVYNGKHPTATVPVVVGHEIAGRIVAVCGDSDFHEGDRVTVEPLISCHSCSACRRGHEHVCRSLKLLGIHEDGGYAQYVKAPIDKLVRIPDSLPDDIAALAEPFAVGYHVVSRSGLEPGATALVIGAGPIGIIIALTAMEAGAARVVITDPNVKRLALAESFGIEGLHPAGDALDEIRAITDGDGFDVVFEASSSRGGILMSTKACRIRGTIVPLTLSGLPTDFCLGEVSFKELSVIGSRVYTMDHFRRGVELLATLAARRDLRPLISDVLPLDDAQRAIDMMMAGENNGKILIDCRK